MLGARLFSCTAGDAFSCPACEQTVRAASVSGLCAAKVTKLDVALCDTSTRSLSYKTHKNKVGYTLMQLARTHGPSWAMATLIHFALTFRPTRRPRHVQLPSRTPLLARLAAASSSTSLWPPLHPSSRLPETLDSPRHMAARPPGFGL